jgi:DNA-binding transcriptional MerR regulator
MAIPPLITEVYLARLLQMHTETLRKWAVIGFLFVTTRINNVAHYDLAAINTLLQQNAHNFAIQPTAEALLSGQLQLITLYQAKEMLGVSDDVVHKSISSGQLAAIKLAHEWRVSLESLQDYWQERNSQDHIPRPLAAHILGVKLWRLEQWIANGELACAEVTYNRTLRPVLRRSLLQLLSTLLPTWIDPRVWLGFCAYDSRPLYSLAQLIPYLSLDAQGKEAHTLMQNHLLAYLKLPGGEFRFLPHSVDMVLQREGPESITTIANLFGVNASRVHEWLSNGLLVCELHADHSHGLYRACLIGILRIYLNPGMRPRVWYSQHSNDPSALLDVTQASMKLGVHQGRLLALLENGTAGGLRIPDTKDEWRISRLREIKNYL